MLGRIFLNPTVFENWWRSAGVSKHEIEAEHGIPRCYWNRWARGRSGIAPEMQQRLMKDVGVPSACFTNKPPKAVANVG